MKRSEFLKSSALMGAGLVAMPIALSHPVTKNKSVLSVEKNTLNLEHTIKDKFITTVDLRNNIDWQFIYGTQLYGTLIGMFGRFSSKSKGAQYQIDQIELKIVNYKGDVSIGFLSDDKYKNEVQEIESELTLLHENEPKGHSYFQADLIGNSEIFNKTIELKGNNMFQKGGHILVNRMLYPLRNIEHIKRRLPGVWQEDPENLSYGIFDSEFFEKDGYYTALRIYKFGKYQPPLEEFPSTRCHQAYVNISF